MTKNDLLRRTAKGTVNEIYSSVDFNVNVGKGVRLEEWPAVMKATLKRLEQYSQKNRTRIFEYMGDEFLERGDKDYALYFYQKADSRKEGQLRRILPEEELQIIKEYLAGFIGRLERS